jgi:hypothetical protein
MDDIQNLISFAFLIPALLILVVCTIYLFRKGSADSILLFVGSLTRFSTAVFYRVIPYVALNFGVNVYDEYRSWFTLIGLVDVGGSILFAVGLLMLILKTINGPKRQYFQPQQ